MKLDDENDYSEAESEESSVDEDPPVQHLSEYPKPFRGTEEENIYEFIKKLDLAFYYNRVRASDRVDVLKRLVKGNAEYSVSDYKSLDENLQWLKKVFGNPHAIWKKEKEKFLQKSREEVENWTDYFSPQRKLMLVKVLNFLDYAEGLAKKFEIKEVVFSSDTIESLMVVLPPKVIHKIIKKERKEGDGISNSLRTFKYMKEVVEDEIETEIVASRYYDIYEESYRIHNGEAHKDDKPEAIESSEESVNKSSHLKTVSTGNENKNLSNLTMQNIKRHAQRIFRNIKVKKNVDKMIENFLSKSKQVMDKNTLSMKDMSIIKLKINQVKVANKNMKAEAKIVVKSKKHVNKEFKPQEAQKTRSSMLDEHVEQEENVNLPEVPGGALEPVKAELVNHGTKANSFEDLEKRLTKLKFFNKTWLKNEDVPKIYNSQNETDPEVPSAAHDDAMIEKKNADQVVVDSIKEEIAAETMLDIKEDIIEPVCSTKEEIEAFNACLSSVKTEVTKSTSNKQVATATGPAMMKVDMNVVIVMMIALIKMKLVSVPAPVTASPAVTPTTSCAVCRTCLCAMSDIKTDQSLTALIKSQGFCGSNKNTCLAGHSVIQV